MAVLVECKSCGRRLRARDEAVGKQVPCPGCGKIVLVQGERVPDHDVFLSYSTKDKHVADAVCAALEHRKIRCWVAPRDIRAGEKWGAAIVGAIEECRVMVLVYSGHANASDQVLREVERAVANGRAILPFRIEEVPMSRDMAYFLGACHWLDALSGPLAQHIDKLVQMVQGLLHGEAGDDLRFAPAPPAPHADPHSVLFPEPRVEQRAGRPAVVWPLVRLAVAAVALVLAIAGVLALRAAWARRKPSVGLADLVPLKTKAEVAWGKAKGLSPGQGLDALLGQAREHERNARLFFDQKSYADAKTAYEALLAACEELARLDESRQAALAAKRRAEAAAKPAAAKADAASLWAKARRHDQTAAAHLAKGDFAKARDAWRQAAAAYAKAERHALGVARVRQAKAFYDLALRALDPAMLRHHGGSDWRKMEAAVREAERARDDFDAAAQAYEQARELLPAAAKTAKAAIVSGLLRQAQDRLAAGEPAEALAAVRRALTLQPGHAEALKLLTQAMVACTKDTRTWLERAEAAAGALGETGRDPVSRYIIKVRLLAHDVAGARKLIKSLSHELGRDRARRQLAAHQARLGDFAGARQTVDNIEDNAQVALALCDIARCHIEAGDSASAGRAATKAFHTLGPAPSQQIYDGHDGAEALAEILKLQTSLGDTAGSKKTLEAVRTTIKEREWRRRTGKPYDLKGAAEALAVSGAYAEAMAAFERGSLCYGHACVYVAREQARAGKFDEARATTKLIVGTTHGVLTLPDFAYYEIAQAQWRAGDHGAAEATALRFGGYKYSARFCCERIGAAIQAGDTETAKHFCRAAQEHATAVNWLAELARAELRLGDRAAALDKLGKARQMQDIVEEWRGSEHYFASVARASAEANDLTALQRWTPTIKNLELRAFAVCGVAEGLLPKDLRRPLGSDIE